MLIPDSPTKIQIIDTQIQQQVQNTKSPTRLNNRGGRTSSTTTVFQKLDSRSHLTTQKNPLNEEGEDHYMVMLNGGDENIQALLLNRERQDKEAPVSATRADGRNKRDEHDF